MHHVIAIMLLVVVIWILVLNSPSIHLITFCRLPTVTGNSNPLTRLMPPPQYTQMTKIKELLKLTQDSGIIFPLSLSLLACLQTCSLIKF